MQTPGDSNASDINGCEYQPHVDAVGQMRLLLAVVGKPYDEDSVREFVSTPRTRDETLEYLGLGM